MRHSGADHGLGRLVHQVSGALMVDRSQHCKVQQEKGPKAAKCPSQTKQEGTGSRVDIGERRRVFRNNVRVALCVRKVDRYGLGRLLRASCQASTAARLRHDLDRGKGRMEQKTPPLVRVKHTQTRARSGCQRS